MAKKINKDNPVLAQLKVNSVLVDRAKVVFVKALDRDYINQNNLGNEILQWFIDNAPRVAANQSK